MKIAHLSDLHFGTEENRILQALRESLLEINPDLVIVSGDFTQIGSRQEYEKARDFLSSLSIPSFCIPGNHDIPARNLKRRFLRPYDYYREYINKDLCPVFSNEKVIILGLNSARRMLLHWNWANGSISREQRRLIEETFSEEDKRLRICVMHHPIHKVPDMPIDVTVFGRKSTLETIKNKSIDLVLTGHVHHASITTVGGDDGHKTLFLSASTALSSRIRDQENGFNVITVSKDALEIDIFSLSGNTFKIKETYKHLTE
jgi:3',5'-cyclic AMP phosphodiesterase CpdA